MKTQCPHCKAILKVDDKHNKQKAKCPKCSQPFMITSFSKNIPDEVCTSCSRTISGREQACLFGGQVVCTECDQKLRKTQDNSKSKQASTDTCGVCGRNIGKAEKAYVVDAGLICVACDDAGLICVARDQGLPVSQATESEETKKEKSDESIEHLVARKESYNRQSFYFGVPGIILHMIGTVVLINLDITQYQQEPVHITFVRFAWFLGFFSLLAGFVFYAKMKGRSSAWCLVGFLKIFGFLGLLIGLWILGFLKDKLPAPLVYRKFSGAAIASYISGILSIYLFPLLVPGLILGIVALMEIRGGKLRGLGYAITGIVFSCIVGIGGCCAFIFFLVW